MSELLVGAIRTIAVSARTTLLALACYIEVLADGGENTQLFKILHVDHLLSV